MRRTFAGLLGLAMASAMQPQPALAQDAAVETAQVEDLTSVREIKRLQAAFGHLGIGGRWEDMAAMFTEDAVITYLHGEIVGRAEILADLRQQQGGGADGMAAGRLNLHLWISPVITLSPDGQSAQGRWHEMALTGVARKSADWAGGTWQVDYRRVGGEWKIAAMRYFHHYDGPFAGGWHHVVGEMERAPFRYAPEQVGAVLPQRRAGQAVAQDALAAQATHLLDAAMAQNTVNAFGYYLDRGMMDDAVELFSEAARLQVMGQGNWYGQDGARRYLQRFGAPGLDTGELNDRPLLMPLVNVAADGSAVLVSVVELGMTGQHGGEGYWSAALLNFRLGRNTAGRWQIEALQRVPLMRANAATGWANPLPAALPVPAGGEADAARVRDIGFDMVPTVVMPSSLTLVVPGDGAPQPVAGALAMAEAFDAAENLSNAYGQYIDQFAWRETASLFAPDGWRDIGDYGADTGREPMLASLLERYGDAGPSDSFQVIHQTTQPVVSLLDGARAMVRTRLLQVNSATDASGSLIAGSYENQVEKVDGIWRFTGMRLDYSWSAGYDAGWAGLDATGDCAVRGICTSFPQIAPLPFHYANPVSGREPPVRYDWSDTARD